MQKAEHANRQIVRSAFSYFFAIWNGAGRQHRRRHGRRARTRAATRARAGNPTEAAGRVRTPAETLPPFAGAGPNEHGARRRNNGHGHARRHGHKAENPTEAAGRVRTPPRRDLPPFARTGLDKHGARLHDNTDSERRHRQRTAARSSPILPAFARSPVPLPSVPTTPALPAFSRPTGLSLKSFLLLLTDSSFCSIMRRVSHWGTFQRPANRRWTSAAHEPDRHRPPHSAPDRRQSAANAPHKRQSAAGGSPNPSSASHDRF